MKKLLKQHLDHIYASAVFGLTFITYLLTIYPTVGTEDSGALITSSATLDIAHPPGYPLYTLLGKLFTILIPFGNIGWRVNLMSAFFGAATVTLCYYIIKSLTKNPLIAIGFSLMLGFNDIFWSQSIRAEVYTLNAFALVLVLFTLIKYHQTRKAKFLYLATLFTGLGISNHHLMILGLPAIAIFLVISDWKIILKIKTISIALLTFIIGLSVYAYLPIRSTIAPYENPAYIKHDPLNTVEKFTNFVNRSIYGGTIKIDNTTSETTEETPPSFIDNLFHNPIVEFITEYSKRLIINNGEGFIPLIKIILEQTLYLPLLFLVPTFLFFLKKKETNGILLTLFFLSYTCLLLLYVGVRNEMSWSTSFSNRPFYINAIIIAVLLSAMGAAYLTEINKKLQDPLEQIFLLLPALFIFFNFAANNESKNYLAYDFNKLILSSVPPNATLLSTGKDNVTFPLYYLKKIENYRPDVNLIINYYSGPVTASDLDRRMKENNVNEIYLDFLPDNYEEMNLIPYNFIYKYRPDQKIPTTQATPIIDPPFQDIEVRGLKRNSDWANTKVKGWYYLKRAMMNPNTPEQEKYFKKVKSEIQNFYRYYQFIEEFENKTYKIGMV